MTPCDPSVLLNHTIIGFEVVGEDFIEVFVADGIPDVPAYIIQPVEGVIDMIEGELVDLCDIPLRECYKGWEQGLPVMCLATIAGAVYITFAALDVEVLQP